MADDKKQDDTTRPVDAEILDGDEPLGLERRPSAPLGRPRPAFLSRLESKRFRAAADEARARQEAADALVGFARSANRLQKLDKILDLDNLDLSTALDDAAHDREQRKTFYKIDEAENRLRLAELEARLAESERQQSNEKEKKRRKSFSKRYDERVERILKAREHHMKRLNAVRAELEARVEKKEITREQMEELLAVLEAEAEAILDQL